MAAQLIFGLIFFFVSYAGTAFLLIEILMWAMSRLDGPTASSTRRGWAVECELPSELSVQVDLGSTYEPEACTTNAITSYQFDLPGTANCQQHSLACLTCQSYFA